MKILFLNSFPQWGGDEKWTLNCLNFLRERGHEVFLACLPDSPLQERAQNMDLEVFPFRLKTDTAFWKIPALQRFLREKEIEVFLGVQNRDVKIGALSARLGGIPAIFSRQGLNIMKKKIDHRIPFTRFIDGIITNAQAIKDQYLGYGWFQDDNFIKVIYDGMEPLPAIETIDIRETLHLPPQSNVLFSAGRLTFQKGYDLLIQAARMAKDKGFDWQFVIAGEGKLKDELVGQSQQLKVDDIVHFIGFRTDITALMKAADLFVLPSRSEGMPNVLREAMAMGRACVAAAVNGVPELIEHEKSGLLTEKENVTQLFEGIQRLLDDKPLRTYIEKNAHQRVTKHFTMERMIDKLEAAFSEQLVKSRKQ